MKSVVKRFYLIHRNCLFVVLSLISSGWASVTFAQGVTEMPMPPGYTQQDQATRPAANCTVVTTPVNLQGRPNGTRSTLPPINLAVNDMGLPSYQIDDPDVDISVARSQNTPPPQGNGNWKTTVSARSRPGSNYRILSPAACGRARGRSTPPVYTPTPLTATMEDNTPAVQRGNLCFIAENQDLPEGETHGDRTLIEVACTQRHNPARDLDRRLQLEQRRRPPPEPAGYVEGAH